MYDDLIGDEEFDEDDVEVPAVPIDDSIDVENSGPNAAAAAYAADDDGDDDPLLTAIAAAAA